MKSKSETIRAVFAQNVKNQRNIMKFSQEKLAEKSNMSVQSIKDIEACRRWVTDNSLSNLAKALNVMEFQLFLPEKYLKDKKYQKPSVKSLISLRENVKSMMQDQFEKAIDSGDFS